MLFKINLNSQLKKNEIIRLDILSPELIKSANNEPNHAQESPDHYEIIQDFIAVTHFINWEG